LVKTGFEVSLLQTRKWVGLACSSSEGWGSSVKVRFLSCRKCVGKDWNVAPSCWRSQWF